MAGTLTPQAARYATLPLDKMRPGEKVGLVGQGGPLGQAPPPYTASGNLFTPAQLPLTNGHATHGYGSTVAVTQHNGAAGQGGPLGQVRMLLKAQGLTGREFFRGYLITDR